MLSLILYGRNDDHGYNYHKRLAVSLNCAAEILSDPADEIVFVDYNTPNELPTIIEAIQDTLTLKAKSRLRVLRVRPSQHRRFAHHTTVPVLEPVARNIGIRRARTDNKWILSTNVDMVFVPEKDESLSQIVSTLKEGFYSLPRLELPENLWELSFDRLNPEKNISLLRQYSQKLHLNTVIRKEGFLKYDNPGDFQLMLRKDILEMGGFDERMLKGWHVDSNLCKRMFLWNKGGDSIEKLLKGYHCNHTYKESFLHSHHRSQNDWKTFVDHPSISPILIQPNWGLADEKMEEIVLGGTTAHVHLKATLASLKGSSDQENEFLVSPALYNHLVYSPSRIFVYLADHLCHLSEHSNITYIGYNFDLVCKMRAYLENRQWKGQIFCQKGLIDSREKLPSNVILSDFHQTNPSLFIVDFGIDENSSAGQTIVGSKEGYQVERRKMKKVLNAFFAVLKYARRKNLSTKFIGINVNYTDFGVIFNKHLSVRLNSYITGISYGYLPAKKRPQKKLAMLQGSTKKGLLLLRYIVARYLFNYSDPIRQSVLRAQRSKFP